VVGAGVIGASVAYRRTPCALASWRGLAGLPCGFFGLGYLDPLTLLPAIAAVTSEFNPTFVPPLG